MVTEGITENVQLHFMQLVMTVTFVQNKKHKKAFLKFFRTLRTPNGLTKIIISVKEY
jgi:hypothetical protein